MYHLRSRFYDPQVGRFINGNSQINAQDGVLGYNLFAYANNNPVMYCDPEGHSIILACIIIGAVIGAIAGGCTAAYVSKKKTGKVKGWAVAGGIVGGAAVGGLIGWGVGAAITAIGAAAAGAAATTAAPVVEKVADNLSTAVNSGGGQEASKVLYHVTTKIDAQKIADIGQIISKEGGSRSLVYALNFQPTLSQAQNLSARSVETVIKFSTSAAFEKDYTCVVNGALRSVFNGPIDVFGVTEVGFK